MNDQTPMQDESTWTTQDDELLLSMMESSTWTRNEEILFQSALLMFPADIESRWEKIAEMIPGKTPVDVIAYYEELVGEVNDIDSGGVELPGYPEDDVVVVNDVEKKSVVNRVGSKRVHGQRKKGSPWSPDEHRKFLMGLEMFGKGDWRSISRVWVKTRNATQVASHAQKYYQRQNHSTKEKKRSSIHDITINDTAMVVQPTPPPPSSSPPTTFYGGVQQSPTPPPTNFHGSISTMVVQRPPPLPPIPYSSPPTPSQSPTTFYGGVQQPPTPSPTNFHGSISTIVVQPPPPQPLTPSPTSFYGGVQPRPAPASTGFYGGQRAPVPAPPQTGSEYQQNFGKPY